MQRKGEPRTIGGVPIRALVLVGVTPAILTAAFMTLAHASEPDRASDAWTLQIAAPRQAFANDASDLHTARIVATASEEPTPSPATSGDVGAVGARLRTATAIVDDDEVPAIAPDAAGGRVDPRSPTVRHLGGQLGQLLSADSAATPGDPASTEPPAGVTIAEILAAPMRVHLGAAAAPPTSPGPQASPAPSTSP